MYKEPTKRISRKVALSHAVEILTVNRERAAIVPEDYVERIKNYLLTSDVKWDKEYANECKDEDIESWKSFRSTAIGTKSAADLTVAYLAGPSPSNDLLELLNLGLRPENIWAFEVNSDSIASGLTELEAIGLRGIKFIPISMNDYLKGTPRRFDIIYVDACGPFPSSEQKTTKLIVDIFAHGALAPLGVLISNFSLPMLGEEELLKYAYLVASYLYPKDFLEDDECSVEGPIAHSYEFDNMEEPEQSFILEVKNNFPKYYGNFITRHIFDIATIISPMIRLINSNLYKVLFDCDIDKAINRGMRYAKFNPEALNYDLDFGDNGEIFDKSIDESPNLDGDAISDSSLFSLIWTMANCGYYETDENFNPSSNVKIKKFLNQWRNQLGGEQHNCKFSGDQIVAAFYAWSNEFDLSSDALKKVRKFPYSKYMPLICDVPTEEISFYPAFAQLAFPSHSNIRETKRFKYQAEGKAATMFLDVIPFDECRYVYDWISSLHLLNEDWFDLSSQLTFRFALDAIVKDRRWFGADLLFGCHAIGISAEFPPSEILPREEIKPS